jgi:hypothetical protein
MQYKDIRHEIKSGEVLAWSHRGWSSFYDLRIQIVRLFTRSEYSHVGVAWVVGGRVLVIEAVTPLVRIYPLSKLGDFYRLTPEITWTTEVETFALSHVGQKYSQWQAVKAFFGFTSEADGLAQCAELVRGILRASGDPADVDATPTEVVNYLLETGKTLTLIRGDND